MKWKFWKKEKTVYIIVDKDFVNSTMAYIGQATVGLAPLIQTVIGVPLGFWIIKRTIELVEKEKIKKLTFWQKLLKFIKIKL